MVVDLARPKFTSDKWGKKLQNGKCTIRIPKDATEASVMFAKNNVAKEVVLFPVHKRKLPNGVGLLEGKPLAL
jgi:hypothetical protein